MHIVESTNNLYLVSVSIGDELSIDHQFLDLSKYAKSLSINRVRFEKKLLLLAIEYFDKLQVCSQILFVREFQEGIDPYIAPIRKDSKAQAALTKSEFKSYTTYSSEYAIAFSGEICVANFGSSDKEGLLECWVIPRTALDKEILNLPPLIDSGVIETVYLGEKSITWDSAPKNLQSYCEIFYDNGSFIIKDIIPVEMGYDAHQFLWGNKLLRPQMRLPFKLRKK